MEVDDVLLTLWDIGLSYVRSPGSLVKATDVAQARESVGLSGGRDLARVDYWTSRYGWTREEFARRLLALGIELRGAARVLPKGAVSKLKREFTSSIPVVVEVQEGTPKTVPLRDFEWKQIGHIREMKLLLESELVDIHYALAEDFAGTADPVSPAGVRDEHLLSSAATRPLTALGGTNKYQTVELASAALMHSMVHNHAFYNGNKRTALVAMLSLLDRNGLIVTCDQDEIFRWTIRVAQHRSGLAGFRGDKSDLEVAGMAQWLCDHSRLLDKGEKVLTWKFLRRRLSAFDVAVEPTGTRGGRFNLSRTVSARQRGMLGLERTTTKRLTVQMAYGGDGREVTKTDLRYLRRELWLDDDHGIDSAMFYGTDETSPDQFIAVYRKTLVRLAKL